LLTRIETVLSAGSLVYEVLLPSQDGERIAWLYRHADVMERREEDENTRIDVRVGERHRGQFIERYKDVIVP
jgi:GTP-binding protein HflX